MHRTVLKFGLVKNSPLSALEYLSWPSFPWPVSDGLAHAPQSAGLLSRAGGELRIFCCCCRFECRRVCRAPAFNAVALPLRGGSRHDVPRGLCEG